MSSEVSSKVSNAKRMKPAATRQASCISTGDPRFELGQSESESLVLPLHQSPKGCAAHDSRSACAQRIESRQLRSSASSHSIDREVKGTFCEKRRGMRTREEIRSHMQRVRKQITVGICGLWRKSDRDRIWNRSRWRRGSLRRLHGGRGSVGCCRCRFARDAIAHDA